MSRESIALIEPSEEWRDEYRRLVEECDDDAELAGSGFSLKRPEDFTSFEAFVRRLTDRAAGVGPEPGRVTQTTFWAIVGSRIVGISKLRTELATALERDGGHIGYMVRRTERHKGYGRAILALTLAKARELGLERVLLTCNADNEGSARVIINNGGVESEQHSPDSRRFWIDLK